MKPDQRQQLVLLLPMMRIAAGRMPTMNEFHRANKVCDELRDFLDCGPSDKTPEQWLLIAEEATKEMADAPNP